MCVYIYPAVLDGTPGTHSSAVATVAKGRVFLLTGLWSTEGFLNSVSAIDLNGGLVVHLAAGSAALVLTWSFIHLKKQIRGATGGGREPVFCCCFFVFLPPSNV